MKRKNNQLVYLIVIILALASSMILPGTGTVFMQALALASPFIAAGAFALWLKNAAQLSHDGLKTTEAMFGLGIEKEQADNPDPHMMFMTDTDALLDEVVKEAGRLKDKELIADVDELIRLSKAILERGKEKGKMSAGSGKLNTLYLPTIQNLLHQYNVLETAKEDERIRKAKQGIKDVIRSSRTSFETMYKEVIDDNILSAEVDTKVLSQMSEGGMAMLATEKQEMK